MIEVSRRTYQSVLQTSGGGMCAECRLAIQKGTLVVKESLGQDYRYVHPACYQSVKCMNLSPETLLCSSLSLKPQAKALRKTYRRHIASLLPVSAQQYAKRLQFERSRRERALLEILKFLPVSEKILCGAVSRDWYEVSWNNELYPASPAACLRLSALETYLNDCLYCGSSVTAKSALFLFLHNSRVCCKRCPGPSLISLKVIQTCLGLSTAVLEGMKLPVAAEVAGQQFTLLQSLRTRLKPAVKRLIRTAVGDCREFLDRKSAEDVRKVASNAVTGPARTELFSKELIAEVAETDGWAETLREDVERVLLIGN